jgi:hypothetical protein
MTILFLSYNIPCMSLTILSLSYHYPIVILSLSYRSLSYHYPIIFLSLSYHYPIVILSLSYHYPFFILSLSFHYPIVILSLSYRYPIVILSLSYRYPIIILLSNNENMKTPAWPDDPPTSHRLRPWRPWRQSVTRSRVFGWKCGNLSVQFMVNGDFWCFLFKKLGLNHENC